MLDSAFLFAILLEVCSLTAGSALASERLVEMKPTVDENGTGVRREAGAWGGLRSLRRSSRWEALVVCVVHAYARPRP